MKIYRDKKEIRSYENQFNVHVIDHYLLYQQTMPPLVLMHIYSINLMLIKDENHILILKRIMAAGFLTLLFLGKSLLKVYFVKYCFYKIIFYIVNYRLKSYTESILCITK